MTASAERDRRYTPFSISVEREDGHVAIFVAGDLDLASADTLAREVADQRATGGDRMLIDLSDVEFIDSRGLRILLSVRNDAMRTSQVLALVPPAPAARRIFEITATRSLFDWQPDSARS